MPVRLAIDDLTHTWPTRFRGAKVGAVLHPASVDSQLRPTLELLERVSADGLLELGALFGPQHGFTGTTQDNMIEWEGFAHPRLGVPVYSLYGEHREPTPAMLSGLDALFVDLQDVGARYYTFIWTLFLCMKAGAAAGVPVIVHDRPNPLGGDVVEGEPLHPDYRSFVGLHPILVRHAKTIGELAEQFKADAFPDCDLTVMPMAGWKRAMFFDDTRLPWVMPSPNIPTLDTAVVYPGMCLLEGTNLSEGRGTTRPFELAGAPWLDAREFTAALSARELPGVQFREVEFEPTFQKHANQLCGGVQMHVTDRHTFLPLRTGIELIQTARELAPDQFDWKPPPYEYETEKLPIEILLGGPVGDTFPSL
jgi:uncharacterized protein YbbC (DUF1343 family)